MVAARDCRETRLRRYEQFARDDPSRAHIDVEAGASVHGLPTAQSALACRPDDGALSGRARAAHGISRDDVVELVVQHLLEGLHV